jgi:acetyltransferase-like isoleucine patch superfamily enzyme
MLLTRKSKPVLEAVKKVLRPRMLLTGRTGILERQLFRCYYFCTGSSISMRGKNNTLDVASDVVLKDCRIKIAGQNNCLQIGKHCRLNRTSIDIISNNSAILIGDSTVIIGNHMGFTHFLAKGNKTKIIVGRRCLFSYGIEVRTTDSHSILDVESGVLLNPPESVAIEDNVWLGARSLILKGAVIGQGSVIGAGSIVTKRIDAGVVAAGQPCRTLRQRIAWTPETPQIADDEIPNASNRSL